MSRTIARSREVLTLTFSFVGTTGMGSRGIRWSYADNFGVLARDANCTHVHLARLIAGVQKPGLHVHDIAPASGSGRTDGLFAPSHGRSGNGARQWSRVLSGTQQSWCSVNLRRQLQVRAGVLSGIRGAMVNLAQGTEGIWRNSVSSPQ